jgi:Ran GTPase-activating protein (RanGAP) involved in mRNA processing and transport
LTSFLIFLYCLSTQTNRTQKRSISILKKEFFEGSMVDELTLTPLRAHRLSDDDDDGNQPLELDEEIVVDDEDELGEEVEDDDDAVEVKDDEKDPAEESLEKLKEREEEDYR